MLRRRVRGVLNRFGIDVVRVAKPDVGRPLYAAFPEESLAGRRFYNIGAGAFHHPYWTNVDYGTEHYAAVQTAPFIDYDLEALAPLPIESASAELFYSSHTIEHVTDGAVLNMLTECHRALKPGGGIRLTAPDALLYVRAWRRRDRLFWYYLEGHSLPGLWESLYKVPPSEASLHQLLLDAVATQLAEVSLAPSPSGKIGDGDLDALFEGRSDEEALDLLRKRCVFDPKFPGNRINWWSHAKVVRFLEAAGFTECRVSGYGQSAFPPLRDTNCFDSTNPKLSLYVEAVKRPRG